MREICTSGSEGGGGGSRSLPLSEDHDSSLFYFFGSYG
jgi:hypothetical protein